jgi:hypothetical protein
MINDIIEYNIIKNGANVQIKKHNNFLKVYCSPLKAFSKIWRWLPFISPNMIHYMAQFLISWSFWSYLQNIRKLGKILDWKETQKK